MAVGAAKYQVFVSSTYEDLVAERDEVIKAVLEMGHIPVGMEQFSAADEEQWQIIARHIEESDYYVVLIAHRYGSVTPEGISYTRKEYEYARAIGVPCLGFVIDDEAPRPPGQIETNDLTKQALEDFKAVVKQKPVQFWRTGDDLHAKVSIALMKAFNTSPRTGWVRAGTVIDPAASAELLRLSAENAELRKRVAEVVSSSQIDEAKHRDETLRILQNAKRQPGYRVDSTSVFQRDREVTLYQIFEWLSYELMTELTVTRAGNTLAMNLVGANGGTAWDTVAHNHVRSYFADLMTLDLIHPSTKPHQLDDKDDYWTLTDAGVDLLKYIRRYALTYKPPVAEASDDDKSLNQSVDSSNIDASSSAGEK